MRRGHPCCRPSSHASGQTAVMTSCWPLRSTSNIGRSFATLADAGQTGAGPGRARLEGMIGGLAARAQRAPGRQPPPRGTEQAPWSSSIVGASR
jgi:hypothetical protein